MKKKATVLKVDIKEVKKIKHEWPCWKFCQKLLKTGQDPKTRLECWNYERAVPEADWVVPNIKEYYVGAAYAIKRGSNGFRWGL